MQTRYRQALLLGSLIEVFIKLRKGFMKIGRNVGKISVIGAVLLAALLMAAAFIGCGGIPDGPDILKKTVISEKDLSSLVDAPVYGENPVTTAINATQYSSAAIVWTYTGGAAVSEKFNDSAEIAATFTLSPKSGYTFEGFTGPFTHTGAESVSHQEIAGGKVTVTVTFEQLQAQTTTVSNKDLTSLVKKPVYGESPVTAAFSATQYSSTAIVWTYAGGGAVSGTFNDSADIVAAFTLSPRSGYTFEGFTGPFTYTGTKSVSHQEAAGGKVTVTVTFAKLPPKKWVLTGSSSVGSEMRTDTSFNLAPSTVYEVEVNYKIVNALFVVSLIGDLDYGVAGNYAIDGPASAMLYGKTLTGDGFEVDGVSVAPWWAPSNNYNLFFSGTNNTWYTKKIRIKTKASFTGSDNPHLIIRFNNYNGDGSINTGERAWVNYICVRKVDSGTKDGEVTGKNLVDNAVWDGASATIFPNGWTYTAAGRAIFKQVDVNSTVPDYVFDVEPIPPPPPGVIKVKFYDPPGDPFAAPVTGNYPQTLFDYPFTSFSKSCDGYSQTLEWEPDVDYVFEANTEYTAKITFKKFNQMAWMTYRSYNGNLNQLDISNVGGLPSGETPPEGYPEGNNYVVKIKFPKTGATKGTRKLLFNEEFNGNSLDTSNTGNWVDDTYMVESRQGKSSWRGKDHISVSGGNLSIAAVKWNETWPGGSDSDWIRTGCVRTGARIDNDAKWEHSYGYYEARIKPMKRFLGDRNVPWGAFWLTGRLVTEWGGRDQESFKYSAKIGTEIDILETINNKETGGLNSALHWNGYDFGKVGGVALHRSYGVYNGNDNWFQSNIYDGNFHTFALEWSPKSYKFYVDDKLFATMTDGQKVWWDQEDTWIYICRNPLYIKLSIEAANFQNEGKSPFWPTDWLSDTMEVDYVKVWNQPPQ
jgi:hypothetical protein